MKKKIKLILMVVIIVLIAIGVIRLINEEMMFYGSYNNVEKMKALENSYSIDDIHQSIKDNTYTGSVIFSGDDTIWTMEIDRDIQVSMEYCLSILQGKAKLVLIQPDGSVITLVENKNQSSQAKIERMSVPLKKGINRIKVVAVKNTKISLIMGMKCGTFSKLGF